MRTTKLSRLWLLFRYWAERAAGPPVPPPPSDAEITAALSRLPWRN